MKELKFILKNGATETELQHSPDGWDSALIEVDRDPNYLGILRSYTVSLKFVKDGAELLRDIFYNKIQSETFIIIQKLDKITIAYSDVYRGQVDFSTFEDTAYNVSVKLTDMSLSGLIKRNIETVYTIEVEPGYTITRSPGEYLANQEIQFLYFSELLGILIKKVCESEDVPTNFAALAYLEYDRTPVITNAQALAGFNFSKIEISLKDVLKSIFVLFDLVLNIYPDKWKDNAETIALTSTTNSFPGDAYAHIDSVSNIKISPAKDFLYDSVKAGHQEQSYGNDYDTRYELGTVTTFSNKSGIINIQELDLQTPFRADTIGINEYISIHDDAGELDGADITPFVVSTKMVTFPLKRVFDMNNVTIPIPYEDAGTLLSYNVPISPKRIYKLHESLINSCFYGTNTETEVLLSLLNVKIIKSEDNNFTPAQIEDEGTGITRTQPAYFTPIFIEFDGILPDTASIFDLYNPLNSRLTFDYNGETFAGFVVNIKTGLTGKKKTTFKLLSAPENDLTKLIR